ncbi:shikimate kinase AroK [Balneatrix alpica]|uniref:Shikimate kinase n=1 Tax=Balneatrix alpica TaxID=75684 RepID=A0ABV5ZC72_9GAMM|nr:shikimate kinase AroK [Balneatrix alpica]
MFVCDNLILVGPMGAGKTTIGRLLSQSLGMTFMDSDKVIEERAGANIPWIFDVEGEEGFRRREEQTIDELTQQSGIILATGGGAVTREANRKVLGQRGVVIYLHATVEQQIERTAKDKNRPLLQTANPAEVLNRLFAQRDPLYRELATLIINTDRRSPRSVVNEIIKKLKQHHAASSSLPKEA